MPLPLGQHPQSNQLSRKAHACEHRKGKEWSNQERREWPKEDHGEARPGCPPSWYMVGLGVQREGEPEKRGCGMGKGGRVWLYLLEGAD